MKDVGGCVKPRGVANHMVADLVNYFRTYASRAPWVKGREAEDLPGPGELEVYLSSANFTSEKPPEFDETQPLDPGLLLASFKTTSKTPLLVKGPASVAGRSLLCSLLCCFYVKRSHRIWIARCKTYWKKRREKEAEVRDRNETETQKSRRARQREIDGIRANGNNTDANTQWTSRTRRVAATRKRGRPPTEQTTTNKRRREKEAEEERTTETTETQENLPTLAHAAPTATRRPTPGRTNGAAKEAEDRIEGEGAEEGADVGTVEDAAPSNRTKTARPRETETQEKVPPRNHKRRKKDV